MTSLPSGWISVALGELGVEVREAVTPSPGTTYELWSVPAFATGAPELVDGRDIGSAKRVVQPNDVLICKINPRINRVWIVAESRTDPKQIGSPEYLIFRTGSRTLASYLRWYLSSPAFRSWIELSVEGATGSHTRAKSGPILRQCVPLPPLAEQRRIVAAIEEQFSRLDAADCSFTALEKRLDVFAEALISRATGGEWPVVALSEITKHQGYGSSAKSSSEPVGTPVLRMGNIDGGRVRIGSLKYLPNDHPDAAKFKLAPGDLLFNRTNSPELVGKTAVYIGEPPDAAFASYLIRVRLSDTCLPSWASLVMNSQRGREYVARVRTQQVGQANVNGTKLAAMPIPLPPQGEQRRIVAEIEQQLSLIDSLRSAVESAQKRSAALRRAILERAFRGELVPQDPDDEPASVLLERIRAERAKDSRPSVARR